jgi:hypothetical protein
MAPNSTKTRGLGGLVAPAFLAPDAPSARAGWAFDPGDSTLAGSPADGAGLAILAGSTAIDDRSGTSGTSPDPGTPAMPGRRRGR